MLVYYQFSFHLVYTLALSYWYHDGLLIRQSDNFKPDCFWLFYSISSSFYYANKGILKMRFMRSAPKNWNSNALTSYEKYRNKASGRWLLENMWFQIKMRKKSKILMKMRIGRNIIEWNIQICIPMLTNTIQ